MRSTLAPLLLAAMAAACMPAPGTSNTPDGGSPMPESIVGPYLSIQRELAAGSTSTVRANAGNIATAATPLGSPAFRIGTAAVQLSAATELADARAKFGILSDAIIAYVEGLNLALPDGVQLAACESTGRQWLQEGLAVSNPYDPSSNCGSIR
jgi:hypothetical protein